MISFTPIGAPRSFVGPAASAARACAIALSGSSQTNASTRGSIPANRARHSRVHASLVVAPRVIACIQSLKFFTEPLLPNPHNYLKNDKLNYPPDKSNRRRLTIAANRRTLAPGRHSFTQRTQGGLAGRQIHAAGRSSKVFPTHVPPHRLKRTEQKYRASAVRVT